MLVHTKHNGDYSHLILIHHYYYNSAPGVHDPGWCWAQASNLWGLGGPVVRFNLAHDFYFFRLSTKLDASLV
jgi:hypothetical protein